MPLFYTFGSVSGGTQWVAFILLVDIARAVLDLVDILENCPTDFSVRVWSLNMT